MVCVASRQRRPYTAGRVLSSDTGSSIVVSSSATQSPGRMIYTAGRSRLRNYCPFSDCLYRLLALPGSEIASTCL